MLTICAVGTGHSATKRSDGSDPALLKRNGSIDRLHFLALETVVYATGLGRAESEPSLCLTTGCAGARLARLGTSATGCDAEGARGVAHGLRPVADDAAPHARACLVWFQTMVEF